MNFRRKRPTKQGIRNGEWGYNALVKRVFRQSHGEVVLTESGLRKPVDPATCPECATWRELYEKED